MHACSKGCRPPPLKQFVQTSNAVTRELEEEEEEERISMRPAVHTSGADNLESGGPRHDCFAETILITGVLILSLKFAQKSATTVGCFLSMQFVDVSRSPKLCK